MFLSKRFLKIENKKQKAEILMLRKQIRNMEDAITGLKGVGRCISNYCLSCNYAITFEVGSEREPYACLKDSVCENYEPVSPKEGFESEQE